MRHTYHRYRAVAEELLRADGSGARARVLAAHCGDVADLLAEIAVLRTRGRTLAQHRAAGSSDFVVDALMSLYAVSRISDYLLDHALTDGGPAERDAFLTEAGFERFTETARFSPFHHEIVSVVGDERLTTIVVDDVAWAGLRFGELMFARAGVRVRAPAALLDPVAATSCLYFCLRRRGRRTDDPSHGWGSNSQWRTCLDRFYADADGLHLNWDGEHYLSSGVVDEPDGRGTLAERRELLLHRCWVRAPLPPDEHDRYPYSDRLSLRHGAWPLDPADVLPDPAGATCRRR